MAKKGLPKGLIEWRKKHGKKITKKMLGGGNIADQADGMVTAFRDSVLKQRSETGGAGKRRGGYNPVFENALSYAATGRRRRRRGRGIIGDIGKTLFNVGKSGYNFVKGLLTPSDDGTSKLDEYLNKASQFADMTGFEPVKKFARKAKEVGSNVQSKARKLKKVADEYLGEDLEKLNLGEGRRRRKHKMKLTLKNGKEVDVHPKSKGGMYLHKGLIGSMKA